MEKLTTGPQSPQSDWNAACLRLEDFLRAHRMQSRDHLLRLTLELLQEAKDRQAANPLLSPIEATMQLAMERSETWFSQIVDSSAPVSASLAAQGRVAFFASGADRRWPMAFLDPNPPVEMLASVRAANVRAGPSLEFRSLIRKEVDYGPMQDIARETWQQFSWKHVLRAFALWLTIFLLSYGAYLRFLQ